MRRTLASVPLLALLALALAACGGPSGAEPTPTAVPDPRPTFPSTATPIPLPTPTVTLPPEAVDPLDTVTGILLLTERASFCDDVACAVDGFRYDDDPDAVIAKLTAVFGVEPEARSYDDPGYTSFVYRWGDGFLIYFSTGDAPEIDHLVRVEVTAASTGGVAVETVGGVHVGSPWADAVAAADSVREGASETDEYVREARFDVIPTGRPDEFDAILGFGNAGGSGPVTALVGPITTGELPGYFD